MSNALATLKAETEKAGLATITTDIELDVPLADPVRLPDGRTIIPPTINGRPIHELLAELIDPRDPTMSLFPRLEGPPGTGKSQMARLLAHHLWTTRPDRPVHDHQAFDGLVELAPGPSSDEHFFRYEFVPDRQDASQVRLVESGFVRAMREGLVVVIDEVNTARDTALLSINGVLDGRLTLHLPALDETVVAQPGFAVVLTYNPGLVGESDLPEAWYSRFPVAVEVGSNWPAARQLLPGHERLVTAAARLDQQRRFGDAGLAWSPQWREVQSLARMTERVGPDTAVRLFVADVVSRSQVAQTVGEAELDAVCGMLADGGYGDCRVDPQVIATVRHHDGFPIAATD